MTHPPARLAAAHHPHHRHHHAGGDSMRRAPPLQEQQHQLRQLHQQQQQPSETDTEDDDDALMRAPPARLPAASSPRDLLQVRASSAPHNRHRLRSRRSAPALPAASAPSSQPMAAQPPSSSPPPPPPPPPAAAHAMPPRSGKKRLLQKWSAANAAPPSPSVLDGFVQQAGTGGVRKLRRYPKLLTLDENGVPVSVRSTALHRRRSSEALLESGGRRGTVQYWRKSMQLPRAPVLKAGEQAPASPLPAAATATGAPPGALELLRIELERVQRAASTRFHIKMNLRGRSKLAVWLANAEPHKRDAAALAVPKLALDGRLLAGDKAVVRLALDYMRNSPLRVLEALAARLDAKEGALSWATIVRNAGGGDEGGAGDAQAVTATSTAAQAVGAPDTRADVARSEDDETHAGAEPAYATTLSAVVRAAATRERGVM